ncbi:MAG: DNA repair protein RecN [bacterium]
MLLELKLKDFVFIEELVIEFCNGLNILTGETGAGKSIIINAINLLLGEKAKENFIRQGSSKTVIEGIFNISSIPEIKTLLESQDIIVDDEMIIKKEFFDTGRTKTYINGNFALPSLLQKIGEKLVDFHGQYEHQSLLKKETHLDLLDRFGNLISLKNIVQDLFSKWIILKNKLEKFILLENQKKEKLDLLEFQQNEIKDANLKINEDVELEQEKNILKNSQILYTLAEEAYFKLYENENSVIGNIEKIAFLLKKITQIDNSLFSHFENFESLSYQIKDISNEILIYKNKLIFDEDRLNIVEEKFMEINRLKKKYGKTIEEISEKYLEIKKSLEEIFSEQEEIEKIKIEIFNLEQKLISKTIELSEKRKSISKEFQKKVENELVDLGMKKIKFEVNFIVKEIENSFLKLEGKNIQVTEFGFDFVEFMISPNKGESLKPLAKIASGGEISRIMLSIKKILGESDKIPSLIFDEIDTGISGQIGTMLGKKLEDIAKTKQIICITHLSQIACRKGNHYKIEKNIKNDKTFISAFKLNKEERIKEIARILSGKEILSSAILHAQKMIEED